MSTRKYNFAENEYYHIYNRGNSKQKIFLEKEDYLHFQKLLYLCNSEKSIVFRDITQNSYDFNRSETMVDIGAYCLMTNHFHILIRSKDDKGISKFMQKLSTAYSMYFNKKYKRTGSLFEGKFKSQYINKDPYLKYIFAYIHLNPVKIIQKDWKEKGIKDFKSVSDFLKKYEYSSYLDYLENKREKEKILETKVFPKYFENKIEQIKELNFWLKYKEDITP